MPINFVTQGVQLQNPLAQAAQVEQIRNYQTANALSQMKMAAAQKQIEDEKTLNALYQSNIGADGQINRNGLLTGMAQRGMGSKAPALMKQFAEYDKLQNDNQTSFYKGLKAEQEAAKSELENIDPEDPHLPVKLAQWMSRVDKLPLTSKFNDSLGMTSDKRSQIIKQVLENPQTAKDAYYRSAQGLDKALQMHYVNQDLGGSVQTVAMPANHPGTAQVVPGTSFAKSMTPDQVSKQGAMGSKPNYQTIQDPSDPSQAIVVDANNGNRVIGGAPSNIKNLPGLTPKEIQTRDAKYATAKPALTSTSADIDKQIKRIDDLLSMTDDSGKTAALDYIAGPVASRTPNLSKQAVNAQAILDSIKASSMIQGMMRLKQASPTGATGFGNQTELEGKNIALSEAALDQAQKPEQLKKYLREYKATLESAKSNLQEAFDLTYEYRNAENKGSTQTPSSSVPAGNVPPPTPPPGRAQVGASTLNQSIDSGTRQVVRTGTYNGKKVVQYSDGTVDYAD